MARIPHSEDKRLTPFDLNASDTDKLISEYSAAAAAYDRRWARYLEASLRMTMETIVTLPADRVLDVACGTGLLLERMAGRSDESDLVGLDRVPAMLNVARQRLGCRAALVEGDAEQLPFENGRFQLLTSTNALHYFPDAMAALREMRRVISASGHLVVTDWCRDYIWMRVLNRVLPFTRHAHIHTLSSLELEGHLRRAGFKVVGTTRRKIDWFWGLMSIHAVPD